MPLFASPRHRRIAIGVVILMAAATALTYRTVGTAEPAAFRDMVAGYGAMGPAVLIAFEIVQVLFPPIPNAGIGVVSGYLFGAVPGTIYSSVGTLLGVALGVAVSRRFGRPFVEHVVHPDTLDRFDDTVARHGVPALVLLYLFPLFPDDALSLVAGLTPIRYGVILLAAVVGRTPSIILTNVAGDSIAAGRPVVVAVIAAATLVVAVPTVVYRDRVEAAFERVLDRLRRSV